MSALQDLQEKVKQLESQLVDVQARLQQSNNISTKLRNENRIKCEKLEKLEAEVMFTEDKMKSIESRGRDITAFFIFCFRGMFSRVGKQGKECPDIYDLSE